MIGITHVVNTAEGHRFGMVNTDAHFYRDSGIRYLGLPLLDHPCANIREYFHQAADFIDDAIKSGGELHTAANHLTHHRPAMPVGKRKIYFRGSFQFSIVTI